LKVTNLLIVVTHVVILLCFFY